MATILRQQTILASGVRQLGMASPAGFEDAIAWIATPPPTNRRAGTSRSPWPTETRRWLTPSDSAPRSLGRITTSGRARHCSATPQGAGICCQPVHAPIRLSRQASAARFTPAVSLYIAVARLRPLGTFWLRISPQALGEGVALYDEVLAADRHVIPTETQLKVALD